MRERILLIGEALGPRAAPDAPPLTGAAMRTLIRAAGLPYPANNPATHHVNLRLYVETFSRINLLGACPTKWPTADAAESARALWSERPERSFLLLGRRVSKAFGLETLEWFERLRGESHDVELMPHPSGRNRWWNDLGNMVRARRFLLAKFAPALRRAITAWRKVGDAKHADFYETLLEKGIRAVRVK